MDWDRALSVDAVADRVRHGGFPFFGTSIAKGFGADAVNDRVYRSSGPGGV